MMGKSSKNAKPRCLAFFACIGLGDKYYMTRIKNFNDWLNESNRHDKVKIPFDSVKYAFHWVNEGNLFDQIYDNRGIESSSYILRKSGGKKLEMPPLPSTQYRLGGRNDGNGMGVCLTLDPNYVSAGFTGESNVCLVFDIQDLVSNFHVEDLTDNGEAEIRIAEIPNFHQHVKHILIVKKVYEKGDGWEGFYYRAVQEWFPEELKPLVSVFPSQRAIGDALKRLP